MATDETRPLLQDADATANGSLKAANANDIVDFDPSGDPENPRDWPKAYKWGIVALLAFMAFTVYVICCATYIDHC